MSQDSTKIEVRTVVKTVHDTAYIELPIIIERITTFDTLSVLENKYAKSAALVSGGALTHSLETKPFKEPVSIEKHIVTRDSIVYRDRVQEVTKEVPVEKELTWGQRVKQRSFWWLVLAVAGLLGWIFREPLGKAIKILLKLI